MAYCASSARRSSPAWRTSQDHQRPCGKRMGQALQLGQAGTSSRPLPVSSYLGLSPANEVFALLCFCCSLRQTDRVGRLEKLGGQGWASQGEGLSSL